MNYAIPLKILVTGPIALGLAIAAGCLLAWPELRALTDLLFVFGAGAVIGLVIFAPVAAALAFRKQLRPWAAAHGFAVQWHASIGMVFSLGYLLASVRHHASDALTGLAVLILFLSVLAEVVFGIILLTGDEPPSNGRGGPRPPPAPVLRPPGGRPPTLSAAAKMEYESAA